VIDDKARMGIISGALDVEIGQRHAIDSESPRQSLQLAVARENAGGAEVIGRIKVSLSQRSVHARY
jgi:hypothetical protein